MIAARQVLERRLLASLEQGTEIELPPPWRGLRPADSNLRPAAAVLLRVAAGAGRAEMAQALRATAARVAANREGRDGGEKDLWPRVAAALDALGQTREGGAGLFGLQLWSDAASVPVQELWVSLGDQVPQDLEAGEPFLSEVARVLVCALARHWMEEARRQARS